MKIVKLQAENIKKLKAVEITPDDNMVIISGKNENGKSSVLDSIVFALGGKDALKDTPRPIHDGEEKASVVLDLEDMIITRHWTSNEKSYLKVENKDGFAAKSPQKLLDNLVGRLSFDPLEFSNMDDKNRLKTFLELVELPFDPDSLEQEKKEIYDQRTLVNREIKNLEGQLSGLIPPSDRLPEKEVNSADILEEMRQAQELKEANNQKRLDLQNKGLAYKDLENSMSRYKNAISDLEQKILEIQQQIESYNAIVHGQEKQLKAIKADGEALRKEVDKLVDPDMEIFKEKLAQVEITNQAIRNAQEYKKIQQAIKDAKTESAKLTDDINAIEKRKEDAIRTAKMPIDGLGFDESGVTYKGFPFKQCSAAERLKISLAMAMELNPELRVIRIMDGSLLDSDNLKLIGEMAKEKDYQIWMEVVDDTGKVGVYIEDGEVKKVN